MKNEIKFKIVFSVVSEFVKISHWRIFNILKNMNNENFSFKSWSEVLQAWYDELLSTDYKTAIKWIYERLDKKIWFIMPWQLIIIWWKTWLWKSFFVNDIAKNIAKSWRKVLIFSLEDRQEDKEKLKLYFEINRLRKKRKLRKYPYNEFMVNAVKTKTIKEELNEAKENLDKNAKNIYYAEKEWEWKADINLLRGIIKQGVEQGVSLLIIDHLQEFKVSWTQDRYDLKLEDLMYEIKDICNNSKMPIILISHFKKVEWKPNINSFKDSIAITQVANKVLIIDRDPLQKDWITTLTILKNREVPWGTGEIEMIFDIENMIYTNTKNEKPVKKIKNSFFLEPFENKNKETDDDIINSIDDVPF